MKNGIIMMIALIGLSVATMAQNEAATANDRDGVVLYAESMPANQYRHLGTVQCSSFSPDKIDPLIDHMIKQARKKHEEFDALIFRSGKGLCGADVIQFYRDPKAKKKRGRGNEPAEVNPEYKKAKAKAKGGKLLFIENSPTAANTLLGKIEIPATSRSATIEELIKELMKIAAERYPDHDGVVIVSGSDVRKANVIKFN